MISLLEMEERAIAFKNKCKSFNGDEKSEGQTFVNNFVSIFGINPDVYDNLKMVRNINQ